jgi:hypothetical protein
MWTVIGSKFLCDAFVFFNRKQGICTLEDLILLRLDMSPYEFRQTPGIVNKILSLAGPQSVLNTFQQGALLIVLKRDLTQTCMFFCMACLQQSGKKNGFLFFLVVIVSKSMKKLENALHIAIVQRFTVRYTVGHFAKDIERTKDVPMLFQQDARGFHGVLLSLQLCRASSVP